MPDSWERQVIANLNKIRRQSCSRTEKKTPTAVCTFLSVPFFFRVGRGRQSEGSTAGTARKSPERPWTAARTMEVLRRCPLAIAQRLVLCAIAVSIAVLGQSQRPCPLHRCWRTTWTTQSKGSPTFSAQLHLPSHELFWANLKVQLHLPPLRSLDLAWNLVQSQRPCGEPRTSTSTFTHHLSSESSVSSAFFFHGALCPQKP